ncbi:26S proteasome non-ATPase regulatory subunit 4 isoform X1 [Ixodes scapularis]
MVLESTVVCVDNSEYMRNGDFIPTRLQAQQDAVSLVCHSKTRSNPENNVGLLTLASSEVLATLTTDVGRLLSKLHQVQPKGDTNLLTAIRVAHLVLKHRQGKNHKMRIVVFVGSPIETDTKELTKLAKRLKKEKVNVDVVNFGEEQSNTEKLAHFVNTLNGKEGSGSHLGEDGTGAIGLGAAGFEFGVDPNEDPELALALRVSMEEQRQRQEDEARRVASAKEVTAPKAEGGSTEEELLERALAMSLDPEPVAPASVLPDFATMSEEEQIAYAMQMSLQQAQGAGAAAGEAEEPMETEEQPPKEVRAPGRAGRVGRVLPSRTDAAVRGAQEECEPIRDPAFLLGVLGSLPGVDPHSEAVRRALGSLTRSEDSKDEEGKDRKDAPK